MTSVYGGVCDRELKTRMGALVAPRLSIDDGVATAT